MHILLASWHETISEKFHKRRTISKSENKMEFSSRLSAWYIMEFMDRIFIQYLQITKDKSRGLDPYIHVYRRSENISTESILLKHQQNDAILVAKPTWWPQPLQLSSNINISLSAVCFRNAISARHIFWDFRFLCLCDCPPAGRIPRSTGPFSPYALITHNLPQMA